MSNQDNWSKFKKWADKQRQTIQEQAGQLYDQAKEWADQMEQEAEKRRQEAERNAKELTKRLEQEKVEQDWAVRNLYANLFALELDEDFTPQYFTVAVFTPKETTWNPHEAVACTRALSKVLNGNGRLAIVGSHDQILWTVTLEAKTQDSALQTIEDAVTPYYSTVKVEPYQEPVPYFPIYKRASFVTVQPHVWMEVGQLGSQIKNLDPLATLVGTMSSLRKGEVLRYEVVVLKYEKLSETDVNKILQISAYDKGVRAQITGQNTYINTRAKRPEDVASDFIGGVMQWGVDSVRKHNYNNQLKQQYVDVFDDPKQTQRYYRKLMQPITTAHIFFTMEAPSEERIDTLFESVIQTISNFDNDHIVHTELPRPSKKISDVVEWSSYTPVSALKQFLDNDSSYQQYLKAQGDTDNTQTVNRNGYHLYDFINRGITPDELAAYWHLPYDSFSTSTIQWSQNVPEVLLDKSSQEGVIIGQVGGKNKRNVSISHLDRAYPTVITGMPGMGKSTTLHNLIRQDIRDGRCVVAIDPTGDLINRVLATSITPEQLDRIVLLEVGNTDYPVPLNPLRVTQTQTTEDVISGVLWMLHSLYSGITEQQTVTRINQTLRSMLPLMLSYSEATPFEMVNILNDEVLLNNLVHLAKEQDTLTEISRDFWQRYKAGSASVRTSMTGTTINRITSILGSKSVELVTCHPYTLDYKQLIQQKKVVLINLSGNNIIADRGILGAIFFAQFYLASLSLGQIQPMKPPRCNMYVDEADLFIATALPEMFAKMRQYGLSVTLATQSMRLFPEDVRKQLYATRGTFINFGTEDPSEAKENITSHAAYLSHNDLLNLKKGQAILKTRYKGNPLPSFIIDTLDEPTKVDSTVNVKALKQQARDRVPVVTVDGPSTGLIPSEEVRTWWDNRKQAFPFIEIELEDSTKPNVPEVSDLDDYDPDYIPAIVDED